MNNTNKEIRIALLRKGITQTDLAKSIGVTKNTLCAWLRYELPREKKDEILKAIKEM